MTKETKAWVFSCENNPKVSKDPKKFLLKGSKRSLFQGSKRPFLKDQKVPSQGSKKSLFKDQKCLFFTSVVQWNDFIRTISNLFFFFFFFMKRFRVHKNTHKQKWTNKTKLSKHWTTKAPIFHAHKLESHLFYFLVLFVHAESFHKKKIDRFEFVLITLFHYTPGAELC